MTFTQILRTCLCITTLLLQIQTGFAQNINSSPNQLRVHGFVAQSYLKSNENSFFGDSKNGSFEFQELGLNGFWHPSDNLHLAAQLVARDAGETDDGDPRIDYAFVDYSFAQSTSGESGIRLGRVVNPYAFYNDTRDIAATRPGILLPQSIYFDVNRNFALSSDGGQLYHEFGNALGSYTFQFSMFEPRTEDPDFEPAIFFQEVPGELDGAPSWMGRIIYEHDLGRIRLGLTVSEVNVDYEPGTVDPIAPGEFHFRPAILSAQYNAEQWSLTAEYARRTTQLDRFGAPLDVEFTGSSYFVQATYRPHQAWEVFMRYDELVWNNDDKNGLGFESLTGLPHYSRFAKDWTIGLRWDITPRVMLRAEWHRVNGTGWLSLLENTSPVDTEQHWNLFALSASYRF